MADLHITDQTFQEEVLNAKTPVLVDFWATWCAPCRIIAPIVEDLAKEYEGKLKVGKLDVDQNPQASGQFGVMSIPTLMIFKDGKPVKTMIGAQPKDVIKKSIDEALS